MTPEEKANDICAYVTRDYSGVMSSLLYGGALPKAVAQAIKEAEREAVEPYLRVVEAARTAIENWTYHDGPNRVDGEVMRKLNESVEALRSLPLADNYKKV